MQKKCPKCSRTIEYIDKKNIRCLSQVEALEKDKPAFYNGVFYVNSSKLDGYVFYYTQNKKIHLCLGESYHPISSTSLERYFSEAQIKCGGCLNLEDKSEVGFVKELIKFGIIEK